MLKWTATNRHLYMVMYELYLYGVLALLLCLVFPMWVHIPMSWINMYEVNVYMIDGVVIYIMYLVFVIMTSSVLSMYSCFILCSCSFLTACYSCLVHLHHCYDVINQVHCINWCNVHYIVHTTCPLIGWFRITTFCCVCIIGIKMNDTSYLLETTWRFLKHNHTHRHGPEHNSAESQGIFEWMPCVDDGLLYNIYIVMLPKHQHML